MYVLAPTNLVNSWDVVGFTYVGQSWWDFELGAIYEGSVKGLSSLTLLSL